MNLIRRFAILGSVPLALSLCSLAQNSSALAVSETTPSPLSPQAQQGSRAKVICSGDQLTISANGSPLSSILAEVSRCTGAKIEGSETAAHTRFFETIGPAPIHEVLASLLDATGINYVIQVSDLNPHKVATVMLLARSEHGNTGASLDDRSTSGARRGFLKQMQQNSRDAEEAAPPEESAASLDAGAAEARSGEVPDFESVAADHPQAAAPLAPAAPADSAPASSQMNLHDRIADMQRMFEQRKQMLQDQNSHPH